MPKESLEQLFEFIARHIPAENIIEAKKEYQKSTGQIHEDDKSYNMRMALFLEWYLLDNYVHGTQSTILEDIIEKNLMAWDQNRLEVCKNIANNIQALFEIKKVRDNSVTVLDLFTDEKYLIDEENSISLFRKNDIFQGRIVSHQDKWFFTGNFCFHANEAHQYIRSEVKKIFILLKSWKKELKSLEKELLKTQKSDLKNSDHIVQIKREIECTNNDSKRHNLTEKLSLLKEDREKNKIRIQQKDIAIAYLKSEKIKLEGPKMIADLVDKLAYMKLKWERSRKVETTDIYKN